jgi:hypothetical protein
MGGPVRSTRDQMHITLNNKGVFVMNCKTYDELGKPKAVVFDYEESTQVIGVSAASPQLREAFPVKEKGGYYIVYGIPFCRFFGIKLEGTEKFVNPEFDEARTLQLDLQHTAKIFGGYRRLNKLRKQAEKAQTINGGKIYDVG